MFTNDLTVKILYCIENLGGWIAWRIWISLVFSAIKGSKPVGAASLEEQIVRTNPVLEAFGWLKFKKFKKIIIFYFR